MEGIRANLDILQLPTLRNRRNLLLGLLYKGLYTSLSLQLKDNIIWIYKGKRIAMKKLLAIMFSWRNTVHFLYEHILCYLLYIFTNEILSSSISYTLSYLNYSSAAAFAPNAQPAAQTALNAVEDRRAFLGAAAGIAAAAIPAAANAKVDYADVALLGGSNTVDLNNANVRAYLRMPGMYPAVAGKIVSHGPYKSVSDVYNIPGMTQAEKDVFKKYESRMTAKEPAAEYVIDRINNGLYR